MSGNAPIGAEGSQPSRGTQAVAVLSRFRAALMAGQRPQVEEFLPDWTESGHSALLRVGDAGGGVPGAAWREANSS